MKRECLQALRKYSKRYFKGYCWVNERWSNRVIAILQPEVDERNDRFLTEMFRRGELVRSGEAVLKREEDLDWVEQVDREFALEAEKRERMWEEMERQWSLPMEDEEEELDAEESHVEEDRPL